MKKIAFLIVSILLSVACLGAVGCKKPVIKLYSVAFRLNGGKWSEEYVQALNLESDSANVIKVFNSYYFEGMNNGLPTAENMVAPSGKVFGGWYLDKDFSGGKNWSYPNWQAVYEQDEKSTLLILFARWINADARLIICDLVNPEYEFTEEFKSHSEINHNSPAYTVNLGDYDGLVQNLPTASDIVIPEGKEFVGWSIGNNANVSVTAQNLADYFTENEKTGFVRICPVFKDRQRVVVACNSFIYDENYTTVNGFWSEQAIQRYRAQNSGVYTENSSMVVSFIVYRDEYESIFENLPTFSDLKKFDWETQEFYEYDIVGWNVIGYDEVNQVSTYTPLTKELFLQLTEPYSIYDSVSYISIIPVYEKV